MKDWESQEFAYFDIGRIHPKPAGNGTGSIDLVLGDGDAEVSSATLAGAGLALP